MTPAPSSQRESARQRALRIRLDYIHHPDRVTRWKRRLALLAAALTLIYVAWVAAGGRDQLSPGAIASPHQRWAHDCQACHAGAAPLRDDATPWLASWLDGSPLGAASPHAGAARCQTCHPVPSHHRLERSAEVASCATCHREHQGEFAVLRRVANEQCVRCHRDLAGHRTGPSAREPSLGNVLAFQADPAGAPLQHPEFRSLRSDPGTIAFDHRLHLTLGLPARDAAGQPGRTLKTLADLPLDQVERYRQPDQPAGVRPDSEYAVQLRCESCHHQEPTPSAGTTSTGAASNGSSSTGAGAAARNASTAYYQPLQFDRDCRACHPLTFDPTLPAATVPHGLDAMELQRFLRQFYAAQRLSNDPLENGDDEREPWKPRRIPAGRTGDASTTTEVDRSVAQLVALAETRLRHERRCSKCHSPAEPAAATDAAAPLKFAPSAIPAVWLQLARFNHQPHRFVECGECHPGIEPFASSQGASALGSSTSGSPATWPSAERIADQDRVQIAGKTTCLKCHSTPAADGATGGVRDDCVLCHQYHGADHFARQNSATTSGPAEPPPKRSIREWLSPAADIRRALQSD